MRPVGYTLIELLIVLSIISLLTIVGFVNFKDFATDQVIIKAAGQVQTMLRLANRNASSSVKCTKTDPAASWLLTFASDKKTLSLGCIGIHAGILTTTSIKDLTLDSNVEIKQIITDPACVEAAYPSYPATLVYSAPLGQIDFVIAKDVTNIECHPQASTMTVTLENTKTSATKNIIISKGGEINVK